MNEEGSKRTGRALVSDLDHLETERTGVTEVMRGTGEVAVIKA